VINRSWERCALSFLGQYFFGLYTTFLTLFGQFGIELGAHEQNERSPVQPDHKGDESAQGAVGPAKSDHLPVLTSQRFSLRESTVIATMCARQESDVAQTVPANPEEWRLGDCPNPRSV
jgi:hypothetical protein